MKRRSKWLKFIGFCLIIASILCIAFSMQTKAPAVSTMAGGSVYPAMRPAGGETIPVMNASMKNASERFQRPSKDTPFPNPYSFQDFYKENNRPPMITAIFEKPDKVILAYYAILQYASNMLGYSGGCGTIGWSDIPYPYAHELLTAEKQERMPIQSFIQSFQGIGYTTLLKLIPAYAPPDTPANIQYFMVEIEVITGVKATTDKEFGQGSLFAYYYGLITVKKTSREGWKIQRMDYIYEDFLCAPMHGWFYLSDAMVEIVYGDNLKLIEKIDKIDQDQDRIYIYADGKEKRYRFDFVRLANGYDILLQENVMKDGKWIPTDLLTDDWAYLKLMPTTMSMNSP